MNSVLTCFALALLANCEKPSEPEVPALTPRQVCERARDNFQRAATTVRDEALAPIRDPAARDQEAAYLTSQLQTTTAMFLGKCLTASESERKCMTQFDKYANVERERTKGFVACATVEDSKRPECIVRVTEKADAQMADCRPVLDPLLHAVNGH